MSGFFVFICAIAFIAVCVWLGLMLRRLTNAEAQRARRRQIERQMRQDIIDARTRRNVADKLLREAGEKP